MDKKSLPNYFMFSSNTLVLCDTFESLVDRDKGYLSRGHCLLELVTTKLPRIDVFGKWYVPGFEKFGQWGKTIALEIKTGETREITWDHFASAGSPVNGNFTVEADRDIIRPLVETYVNAFRTFHTHFMKPMLACESWEEVRQLDQSNLPQLWNTPDMFASPKEWCEYVLPEGYANMLAEGQAKQVLFKEEKEEEENMVSLQLTVTDGDEDDEMNQKLLKKKEMKKKKKMQMKSRRGEQNKMLLREK